MHRFNVSAAVFSRLWALRRDAEQTEDQILRRLLDCPPAATASDGLAPVSVGGPDQGQRGVSGGDFIDATYGIRFAEGDEIFRTYKGRPYSARVVHGRWLLEGNAGPHPHFYDSLNQLSQAVIDGNENAWMFWFYQGPDGGRRRIAELRDPATVQKRPQRNRQREPAPHLHQAIPKTLPETIPQTISKAARQESISGNGAAPTAPRISRPSPPELAHPSPPVVQGGGMAWEPAPKPQED